MRKNKSTYKFRKQQSISGTNPDEYNLSEDEYYKIYSFYVAYSMCKSQSQKQRTFRDYGWYENNISEIKKHFDSSVTIDENPEFVFSKDDDDLRELFRTHNLSDGELLDLESERFVITKTSESNKYFKLFHRIRNGFSHGKFKLRFSENNEKMIIIQDDDKNNVTARIVLRLDTLMKYIEKIDKNNLCLPPQN